MPPLVSVLLPTRNRLEYLRHAVETVLRQDDPDWELVVSDNQSEDDVRGFVDALGDDRIVYVATTSFVPVTDNWNLALAHSRGSYVVMLGDDDALMPEFVGRIRELAATHAQPDLVYQSAWLFAYPGVFPDEPAGYVQPYGYAPFFRGRRDPFVLPPEEARRLVAEAMRFNAAYGFNMQFSTVSRALIDRLGPRGPFFQSSFPDYYATNAAFLCADTIVVEPRPMVAIGVTPKSYGYFHANADERGGKEFLEAHADDAAGRRAAAAEMPGTNINTGWLSAVQTLAQRFPDLVPAPVAMRRFRFLQALFVYEGHYLREDTSAAQLAALEEYLTARERRVARVLMRAASVGGGHLPTALTHRAYSAFHWLFVRQHPRWNPPRIRAGYASLADLAAASPEYPRTAPPSWRQRLRRTTV